MYDFALSAQMCEVSLLILDFTNLIRMDVSLCEISVSNFPEIHCALFVFFCFVFGSFHFFFSIQGKFLVLYL